MKILLIMPDYFPKQNPRVFRWKALAEYWSNRGWSVSVLCASHSMHLHIEVVNGVEVFRVGQSSVMDYLYNFFNIKNRRRENNNKLEAAKKQNFSSPFFGFLHKLWAHIYWPDGACLWIFPARKKAIRLLKLKQFDVIISISLPFSSHLVGEHCKKHFPKITWIVDIGDPFSVLEEFPKNNHLLYKTLNVKTEGCVFSNADAISVTVKGAYDLYKNYFPQNTKKMSIIPPLYDDDNMNVNSPSKFFDIKKINIAYFGSFYLGIRPPNIVLELFKKIIQLDQDFKEKINLHFFGYIEPVFLKVFKQFKELSDSVFLHGLIEKPKVMDLMQQSDFLLNIGNKTTCQLPSKSVDYMVSGKPILNICHREDDTFASFFKNYPLIFNILYKENGLQDDQLRDLMDFIISKKGNRMGNEWREIKKKEFNVETIAGNYEELFRDKRII